MPFPRKRAAGLSSRFGLRLSEEESQQLRALASAAGLSASDFMRARALGRPVVSRTDATTVRELRRLGGLLKHIHLESGGAYSAATGAALGELRAAITRVAAG
jgi:hypothetical protein